MGVPNFWTHLFYPGARYLGSVMRTRASPSYLEGWTLGGSSMATPIVGNVLRWASTSLNERSVAATATRPPDTPPPRQRWRAVCIPPPPQRAGVGVTGGQKRVHAVPIVQSCDRSPDDNVQPPGPREPRDTCTICPFHTLLAMDPTVCSSPGKPRWLGLGTPLPSLVVLKPKVPYCHRHFTAAAF